MADPSRIGRFQVLRPIGEGGMGTVYLAEDPLLKRRVAIKVVRVAGAAREKALLRFRREAEISAQLNHPNLVTVFDVGVEESVGPFLAMEYVEGQSLARHARDRSLDTETTVRVLIQAMRALRAAHRQAIVHRDVKPDNILLSEEGRAKLMDFGVARSMGHPGAPPEPTLGPVAPTPDADQELALRLTSVGHFLGSPAYAAPEVLRGGEGSPASDRYSFAATTFEVLTGQLPHPGTTVTETIVHALRQPIALPPGLPPRLGVVFQRALALDPDERHPSLPAFLEDLIGALPGPPEMKARLYAALGQEDEGGTVTMARYRVPSPEPPRPAPLASDEYRRGGPPARIQLAEDPVETYLASRRTPELPRPVPAPEPGGSRSALWVLAVVGLVLGLAWAAFILAGRGGP